jgi:hypothetical protein
MFISSNKEVTAVSTFRGRNLGLTAIELEATESLQLRTCYVKFLSPARVRQV